MGQRKKKEEYSNRRAEELKKQWKSFRFYKEFIKRPMDFVCALLGVIFLSPVILTIAVLVRVKLGSPVIFTQERPGKDEKIFKLYKFRSMSDARDKDGKLLTDEKRLGKFGRMLRATSLDELPELINILKGDMSVVGPRPLLIKYLPYYTEMERHRHDVRPGLTGLAQINGRNNLSWNERFRLDIEYARDISFRLDISIILKTIKKVVSQQDVAVGSELALEDFDIERKDENAGD